MQVKTRALKEMSETVQELMSGKSKEEMEKSGAWKKKLAGFIFPAIMAGLAIRFIYTKSLKGKDEQGADAEVKPETGEL